VATAALGITLNQICFVYALTNTSASDVALLGATGPGRRHWLSVAIGMTGVVLIVGRGANFGRSSLLGAGLALGATFFSSASALPSGP
jgi:drug/metabolite transporter (DMT)-like permease